MIRCSYCSITVSNHGGTWLIRFVSKNYTHPWKSFANKFRLVLYAYIRLFVKKISRYDPNMALHEYSSVELNIFRICSSHDTLLVWLVGGHLSHSSGSGDQGSKPLHHRAQHRATETGQRGQLGAGKWSIKYRQFLRKNFWIETLNGRAYVFVLS